LGNAQRQVEHSLGALSSGSRIVKAGDDAAGFAISENLRGQLGGIKQAKFNAESATGMIQSAEGGLNEQNNILVRLRELAVYAASDTIGDDEREFLNTEFEQLREEFDRIAKSTRFGSKELLTGTGQKFEFQVGAFKGPENVISFTLDADASADAMGISDLSVERKGEALDTLDTLDEAILKISGIRSTFGAMQSRLQHTTDNLTVQAENIASAKSHITDADVAEEASQLASAQIRQEIAASVVAQANQSNARALHLLALG
jgi:flagellin